MRPSFLLPALAGWLLLATGTAWCGPREDLRAAEQALGRSDVSTAMALYRKAADQGDALAQARLADLLYAAEFDREALALYRKSAEQGEAAGQYGLGRMYANGAAVARDGAQALDWYRKAEAQQYAPALDALARAYRSGDLGLARDLDRARQLDEAAQRLRKAAAP